MQMHRRFDRNTSAFIMLGLAVISAVIIWASFQARVTANEWVRDIAIQQSEHAVQYGDDF